MPPGPPGANITPLRTRAALDKALADHRNSGETLALVPTMGALHDGHLRLIETARHHAQVVVASIYVNPLQFGPAEDLDAYPRDEAGDLAALASAGCGYAYLPRTGEMYPPGDQTRIHPGPLAEPLDGASRPGHFEGVCTVVAKLFGHVRPDLAVFGEKDFQQLQVIRQMTRDLALAPNIVGVPTVREADGLALSSRNRYLNAAQREAAAALPAILAKVAARILGGVATDTALIQGLDALGAAGFEADYLELRRDDDLSPLPARPLRREEAAGARLFVAARMGRTRLIDNRPLS